MLHDIESVTFRNVALSAAQFSMLCEVDMKFHGRLPCSTDCRDAMRLLRCEGVLLILGIATSGARKNCRKKCEKCMNHCRGERSRGREATHVCRRRVVAYNGSMGKWSGATVSCGRLAERRSRRRARADWRGADPAPAR